MDTSSSISSVLIFLIGLLVSTALIYLSSLFLGTRRSFKVAFFTAIIGSIIYAIAHYLLGNGLIAAILGGIAWLIALKSIYRIGWFHALIMAVVIWIITSIIGILLPTAPGPV
jgi:hypothetical protein